VVIVDPSALADAAASVGGLGTSLEEAKVVAELPTTGIVAPAADEVSAMITTLFNSHGQWYQRLAALAQQFHQQFTQQLAGAANAYQESEAANVVALILGGTDVPTQSPTNVANILTTYIDPLFPGAVGQALTTPEQFYPLVGKLTFDQSISQGETILNSAIQSQIAAGNRVVVWATSQSSTVATAEIEHLMATGSPYTHQLSFILTGDPNNPDGGILARFPGLDIPGIGLSSSPATPPNSPYQTIIYTNQYDGISDFPRYPLDVVSDANAVAGFLFGEHDYSYLTLSDVAGAIQLATSPGYTGNTTYYFHLTQDLPLLNPLRWYGGTEGNALADLLQPDLRVLVDMGYGSDNYASIPTPASLLEIPNPFTIIPDLAAGAIQGPQSALVDLGLLPQAMLPNAYPYLPALNPDLNFNLGQSSVTGLSLLTGAEGALASDLGLIPPCDLG
jgi:hypothetical protein